ncbi:MAG: hypothetical protein IPJ90_22395 [Anaerolineaceae bacterium]|nr:hypothetical protein [Anaerolineaceae bacterium]
MALAQEILAELALLPGVLKTAVAGSLRRMKESIGDVDLLVAADDAAPIMDYFVNMPRVESVSGHGPTKSSVVLLNGMQVDLRVLPLARWGTLLSYFTGSKDHNVRLRELALEARAQPERTRLHPHRRRRRNPLRQRGRPVRGP